MARAEQPTLLPVVAFLHVGSADAIARFVAAFRKGLNENGYIEGQNVAVEYDGLEGQYSRLPGVIADVVHRRVAVIVAPTTPLALGAKAATATIPIVFLVGKDPVQLGLVSSLARPGRNATGVNSFGLEVSAKRLRALHDLVPKAVRIALLVNPTSAESADTVRDVGEAALGLGLQIQTFNASTIDEIDAAFAAFAKDRPDALYVVGDAFFTGRREQLAILTARDRIPAAYSQRDFVLAGGLMSYGSDVPDMFHQIGIYTSKILKGTKPTDLPVLQPTKLDFAINLHTARTLGIEVPPNVLAIADVIE